MPKTAKHLAGGVKAGKTFIFRLSEELLTRLKSAAELRGMEVSEYIRKGATDALNNDTKFVEKHGTTFYLGALPAQVDKFLNSPLSREEIYYGNLRRTEADMSLRILASRLAALEQKVFASEKPVTRKEKSGVPAKPSHAGLLEI